MRSYQKILMIALLGLFPVIASAAQAAATFTDSQKAEIEGIVRNLLTKKEPQIVMQAAQVIQERAEAENEQKNNEALNKHLDKIYEDPTSPVGGNPKGDVTIVEFFDYMCGYCKVVQPTVTKMINEDKKIRVIYKEIPILGEASIVAAKAALASVPQGKYVKFHEALMSSKERLTESTIMKIAEETDLDTDKLRDEMTKKKIGDIIQENLDLSKKLGINGTPSFVINNKIYPGAVRYEDMKKAIEEARSAAKK